MKEQVRSCHIGSKSFSVGAKEGVYKTIKVAVWERFLGELLDSLKVAVWSFVCDGSVIHNIKHYVMLGIYPP